MSKLYISFICITIFIVGISIGTYISLQKYENNNNSTTELTRQIQDIVIEQVQANQVTNDESEEAMNEAEVKISPYAKLIIEKHYTKCGHSTVDIMDIPKELINFTEDEFKKKYDKWEVKEFKPKEISIYRDIDANCSSHFVIKEDEGYLTVFSEITNDILEFKEKTDIDVESLRDEDRIALKNGIRIYGDSELSSFLEDFDS